jgi:hypothetical protein
MRVIAGHAEAVAVRWLVAERLLADDRAWTVSIEFRGEGNDQNKSGIQQFFTCNGPGNLANRIWPRSASEGASVQG